MSHKKETGILMQGAMVRALLSGAKTQTRRLVKPQPGKGVVGVTRARDPDPDAAAEWWWLDGADAGSASMAMDPFTCRYGGPGDRLWVRETFAKIPGQTRPWIETDYRATYTHGDRMGDHLGLKKLWTPAIHMPRAACRILLELTDVRVERLQDITEADAAAEGIKPYPNHPGRWISEHRPGLNFPSAIAAYRDLWESINGADSWAANPWVWVLSFKRVPA